MARREEVQSYLNERLRDRLMERAAEARQAEIWEYEFPLRDASDGLAFNAREARDFQEVTETGTMGFAVIGTMTT